STYSWYCIGYSHCSICSRKAENRMIPTTASASMTPSTLENAPRITDFFLVIVLLSQGAQKRLDLVFQLKKRTIVHDLCGCGSPQRFQGSLRVQTAARHFGGDAVPGADALHAALIRCGHQKKMIAARLKGSADDHCAVHKGKWRTA